MNPKEPWLAVLLTQYIPGSGLLYAHQPAPACTVFALEASVFFFGLWSVITDSGNTAFGVILLLALLPLHLIQSIITFRVVREQNPPEWEAQRRESKDPWLATLLSLFIPFLGVLYLKRWLMVLVFVGMILAFTFIDFEWTDSYIANFVLATLLGQGVTIVMAVGTYRLAPVRREVPFKVMVLAFVTAYVFQSVLVFIATYGKESVIEAYHIPSRSMLPVLSPGDRILVWKHDLPPLRPGQIVVFYDTEEGEPYVKRLVALGGETVKIANGRLTVDGYTRTYPPYDNIKYTQNGTFGVGVAHEVAEDSLFVLGDKSEISKDSRMTGDVPVENVIGIPYKIFWPLSKAGLIPTQKIFR